MSHRPLGSILIGVLTITVAACSQGFNRDLVAANMERHGVQVTSREISQIGSLKPQLPTAASLGIWVNGDLRMRKQVREAFKVIGENLIRDRVFSQLNFIESADGWNREGYSEYQQPISREQIRTEASRYGADAVVVIDAQSDVDRYVNPLSILYLTIVGGFFVPGSHADALVQVRATVIDTNNGFLYAVASADGEAKQMRPAFFREVTDAIRDARAKALSDLAPELERRLRNVALESAKQHQAPQKSPRN